MFEPVRTPQYHFNSSRPSCGVIDGSDRRSQDYFYRRGSSFSSSGRMAGNFYGCTPAPLPVVVNDAPCYVPASFVRQRKNVFFDGRTMFFAVSAITLLMSFFLFFLL